MNNQKLLDTAVEILKTVDEKKTDTVEVQTSYYDDGSTMLSINVAFLIPEDDATERK